MTALNLADFVELDIVPRGKPSTADVLLGVSLLGRQKSLRVVLTLEEELAKRIGGDGWPRFTVLWSAKQGRFLVRGKVQGPVECFVTRLGSRAVIRFAPPAGLDLRPWSKVEPEYEEIDGYLAVKIPGVFRKPVLQHTVEAANSAATRKAETVAKAAVPAPRF